MIETPEGLKTIKNDFVFAMTGYHPDFSFLESMGVRFEGPDKLPVCNPETLESNVHGDLPCRGDCGRARAPTKSSSRTADSMAGRLRGRF